MKTFLVGIILAVASSTLVLSGCDKGQPSVPVAQKTEPVAPLEFNTSDKSIKTNNNVLVAAEKLKGESNDSLWGKAEKKTASNLTKSPYSSLGKTIKITGEVYKVEELPPGQNLQGKWSEILLLAMNQNSPLGATTVSCIYNGDVSKIDSGQVVTCAGFFLGTYESQNAMGGTVEGVALLGNKVVRAR